MRLRSSTAAHLSAELDPAAESATIRDRDSGIGVALDVFPHVRADSFEEGAGVYLLSHYHQDHLHGLEKDWSAGPIYASELTCMLLRELSGVSESVLRPVREGETVEEDGLAITALPANHCPGSVMYHLRSGDGGTALYTGDFRLDDEVRSGLDGLGPVDTLYLDSTYADPRYSFPSREEATKEVVRIVSEAPTGGEVMLAVYTIGKNGIVEAVARAVGKPVYLTARTLRVYKLLGLGDFVTGKRDETHLRGYSRGYFDEHFFMLPRERRRKAVVVIPTGWANDEPAGAHTRGGATFHYVPYSEHCDYQELQEALRIVGARRVVEI